MTATKPLRADWTTPYALPPFDQIRAAHFGPAFEVAMKAQRSEVEARLPGASVVEPAGDPLAGALLLVELAEELQDEPGILRTWP